MFDSSNIVLFGTNLILISEIDYDEPLFIRFSVFIFILLLDCSTVGSRFILKELSIDIDF